MNILIVYIIIYIYYKNNIYEPYMTYVHTYTHMYIHIYITVSFVLQHRNQGPAALGQRALKPKIHNIYTQNP